MQDKNSYIKHNNIFRKHKFATKFCVIFIALSLIASGIIFLLENMGIFSKVVVQIIFSWQTLLILSGFFIIIISKIRFYFLPTILIIFGTYYLLEEIFGKFSNNIWSILLISIGIFLFLKIIIPKRSCLKNNRTGKRHKKNDKTTIITDDIVNEKNSFSNNKIICHSLNFKGGTIDLSFSSCELSLRDSELAEGINILKIDCAFSEIRIYLPKSWDVSIESNAVFGGISNKRAIKVVENIGINRKLIIKSDAFFGGGELLD